MVRRVVAADNSCLFTAGTAVAGPAFVLVYTRLPPFVARGPVGYLIVSREHTHAMAQRRIVASEARARARDRDVRRRRRHSRGAGPPPQVMANPMRYTAAVLGMTPAAYCAKIMMPASWGGALACRVPACGAIV